MSEFLENFGLLVLNSLGYSGLRKVTKEALRPLPYCSIFEFYLFLLVKGAFWTKHRKTHCWKQSEVGMGRINV